MAKRGRPMKYATPEEFETKAMSLLKYAENTEGVTPTILWLEDKMDVDFYRYEERKEFCDTVNRVRKRARALYEQKASNGQIVPKVSCLYLSNNFKGYQEKREVEVKQEVSVDPKLFSSLMDKAKVLDATSKASYIDSLREIVADGEEEVD